MIWNRPFSFVWLLLNLLCLHGIIATLLAWVSCRVNLCPNFATQSRSAEGFMTKTDGRKYRNIPTESYSYLKQTLFLSLSRFLLNRILLKISPSFSTTLPYSILDPPQTSSNPPTSTTNRASKQLIEKIFNFLKLPQVLISENLWPFDGLEYCMEWQSKILSTSYSALDLLWLYFQTAS